MKYITRTVFRNGGEGTLTHNKYKEEKNLKKNNRGFTLAELLIVVAIIAVLVAIAIPVFTTQLEKSRDAVSISNVRAAYAEATTALLTHTTSTTYPAGNVKSVTVAADGTATVVVSGVAIKSQKVDNWSGLGAELPGTIDADPGKAGTSEVTFTYDASGKCTAIAVGTPA